MIQSLKRCPRCQQDKPMEEFAPNGFCKPCRSEYDREYHKSRSAESRDQKRQNALAWRKSVADQVREYLECHPCVDCGESDPVVLEFDHVRGVKRGNIATMKWKNSWKVVLAEIEKCEVRCANCHRRVTHARRLANNQPGVV